MDDLEDGSNFPKDMEVPQRKKTNFEDLGGLEAPNNCCPSIRRLEVRFSKTFSGLKTLHIKMVLEIGRKLL
jgi:hypothetical protein